MYLNDWKESKRFGMIADFEGIYISNSEFESVEPLYPNDGSWIKRKAEMQKALDSENYQNMEVLLATYAYVDYQGAAFVLFKKDGKLWEVNGGHCSCYGLEGQWDPEETTPEALLIRKWDGYEGMGADEVRDALVRGGYSV